MDFIAEAYLPGRDLAWTSLWWEGMLIASFGRERLEYIYPNLAPSGRTGTPTIARTVHDHELNTTAFNTVVAIDPKPHGFYSVDLREDKDGIARPTEVNAGRCFTTSYLSTAAGVNFMDLWCCLIQGETPYVEAVNSIPADLVWMRHIDCPELLLDVNNEPVYVHTSRALTPERSLAYQPEYME
jgi:carbamoyl-phosphate synthase large subunit